MNIMRSLATLGNLGDLRRPGTVGSLCALPVIICFAFYPVAYGMLTLIFGVSSFFIIRSALVSFSQSDPQKIILDEVVGMLCVFLYLDVSIKTLMAGLIIFRFFDGGKWCGIAYFERLPGAWGVLFDDIAAGVFANCILRMLCYEGWL